MIEAKIDKEEIKKLQDFFNATEKELDTASNYALRSTISKIKTQLIKETAKDSRIQQKPLSEKTSRGTSRIHFSSNKKEKTARLWFGVYRISLARLNPKQYGKQGTKRRKNSKAGVAAGIGGSIFREGAFLMPISKKNGESAIVPYQVMKRIGKHRLPIEKEVYSYKETAISAEEKILPSVPKMLTDILRSKLKWQTDKN